MTDEETIRNIKKVVSHHTGIPERYLFSRKRSTKYIIPRFIAYYVGYCKGISYPKLGKLLDRHHATIMYGAKKVEDECKTNKMLNEQVKSIWSALAN